MTIFSCLLQHKGAPIFQIKQPLFWKKRQISASLVFLHALLEEKRMERVSVAGCDRPIFCVQLLDILVQFRGCLEVSNSEIFVGLVSEKWLFLCVETAILPL